MSFISAVDNILQNYSLSVLACLFSFFKTKEPTIVNLPTKNWLKFLFC